VLDGSPSDSMTYLVALCKQRRNITQQQQKQSEVKSKEGQKFQVQTLNN